MIIHIPETKLSNGEFQISARIELQLPDENIPQDLWYFVPEEHQKYISTRADGFAAAMLPIAMARNEDLIIRGELSPRLIYGMYQYQGVLTSWYPNHFKKIRILCENITSQNPGRVLGGVASTYSGGVDSVYTVWSHLPDNQPDPHYQVGFGLFAQGFDYPLRDDASYQSAVETNRQALQEIGLELLPVRTNVRRFNTDAEVTRRSSYGAAITSLALVFGNLLSKFFIASSFTYNSINKSAIHPIKDHMLSTETLEIIHNGADRKRSDKIEAIAHWPLMYSRLKVCESIPQGIQNCCRCTKCVRTMIGLELEGVLDQYSTFQLPLTRNIIRIQHWLLDISYLHDANSHLQKAILTGRKDMAFDLRVSLVINHFYAFLAMILPIKARAFLSRLGKPKHRDA